MSEIDLSKYTVRTDLISDTIAGKSDIEGIKVESKKFDDINVERVSVLENGSKVLNKKMGYYVTIAFNDVTDRNNRSKLISVLTSEIKGVIKKLNINKDMNALIIGLGNSSSTPDSLGPKSIDNITVTKYIFDIEGVKRNNEYRNVAVLKPGVYGETGIETQSIVKGVVKELKPDFIIVVDALASSSIERVNKTVQISDSGISPGSGVGNAREELSFEMLGVPVIAIGIPTVVDAVTIVSDTISFLVKKMTYSVNNIDRVSDKLKPSHSINYLIGDNDLKPKEKEELLGIIGNLSEEEIKMLIFEVLAPVGYNLMVTPKEIDFVIDKLAFVIGSSINKAMHN